MALQPTKQPQATHIGRTASPRTRRNNPRGVNLLRAARWSYDGPSAFVGVCYFLSLRAKLHRQQYNSNILNHETTKKELLSPVWRCLKCEWLSLCWWMITRVLAKQWSSNPKSALANEEGRVCAIIPRGWGRNTPGEGAGRTKWYPTTSRDTKPPDATLAAELRRRHGEFSPAVMAKPRRAWLWPSFRRYIAASPVVLLPVIAVRAAIPTPDAFVVVLRRTENIWQYFVIVIK